MSTDAKVADFEMEASTPPMSTRFPAGISSAGIKYLKGEDENQTEVSRRM